MNLAELVESAKSEISFMFRAFVLWHRENKTGGWGGRAMSRLLPEGVAAAKKELRVD